LFIADIIAKLSTNLSSYDITLYPPASGQDLINFERKLNCPLPDDFKALYLFCNGFESAEDIFRIIPLDEISDQLSRYEPNRFSFAEYLIYCDTWEIEINPSDPTEYWISNRGKVLRLLTKSLAEFIDRFLAKGVFGNGGLYAWHDEAGIQNKP
jgi:SMI1 / KNR4 family (SUKH-1)